MSGTYIQQSRLESFIERVLDLSVGFFIALGFMHLFLNIFGWGEGDALKITICFTFISLARSYITRRIFNHRLILKQREHIHNGPNSI